MQFTYTIKVGNPSSGQVGIGGKEIAFYSGVGPDREREPLHFAAVDRYLSTGETTGTVTVTASGD